MSLQTAADATKRANPWQISAYNLHFEIFSCVSRAETIFYLLRQQKMDKTGHVPGTSEPTETILKVRMEAMGALHSSQSKGVAARGIKGWRLPAFWSLSTGE
jgi:hypothetical protein